MTSWSIKNIDLEVGEVERNLLWSRKYVLTMKINAAGKQDRKMWKKSNHLWSANEGKHEIGLPNTWAEQRTFTIRIKQQAGINWFLLEPAK